MKFLLGTVNTPRVDVGWMQPVSAKDPGDKDKGGGAGNNILPEGTLPEGCG